MKKGNKPDFHDAAAPEPARRIYDFFYNKMREGYNPDRVKDGVFQAMMEVELKNDGPVGVNYCSEDAAVHLDLPVSFLAFIDYILTWFQSRSQSKSIPIYPKKNPRSRKMAIRSLRNRTSRDLLNFKFPQNCCSEERKSERKKD